MASIAILLPPTARARLHCTAVILDAGRAVVANPGPIKKTNGSRKSCIRFSSARNNNAARSRDCPPTRRLQHGARIVMLFARYGLRDPGPGAAGAFARPQAFRRRQAVANRTAALRRRGDHIVTHGRALTFRAGTCSRHSSSNLRLSRRTERRLRQEHDHSSPSSKERCPCSSARTLIKRALTQLCAAHAAIHWRNPVMFLVYAQLLTTLLWAASARRQQARRPRASSRGDAVALGDAAVRNFAESIARAQQRAGRFRSRRAQGHHGEKLLRPGRDAPSTLTPRVPCARSTSSTSIKRISFPATAK